jgi:hypothetical protein
LFEAGAANNRTITGHEQEKGGASVIFFRGSPTRDKKPQRYVARAVMRSFGEYSFVEDSRYASQQKSAGLA